MTRLPRFYRHVRYNLRGGLAWPGFERLVDAGFEQIRLYASGDVAVSLRMLRALGDIAATVPDAAASRALVERAERIVEGCAARLGESEIDDLRARLAGLEQVAFRATPR